MNTETIKLNEFIFSLVFYLTGGVSSNDAEFFKEQWTRRGSVWRKPQLTPNRSAKDIARATESFFSFPRKKSTNKLLLIKLI